MTDGSSNLSRYAEAEAAFERPTGQQIPEGRTSPGTRTRASVFVLACSFLAVALTALTVLISPERPAGYGPEIAILFALGILAALAPLQIAYKQELTFEPLVIVLAALIVPVEYAVLTCAIAQVVGYSIRYRFTFAIDCPFNASLVVFVQLIAGGAFWLIGWSQPIIQHAPVTVAVAGALAGLIAIVVVRVMVALVIAIDSRQPLRSLLRDSTLGMQAAEQAMLGAMIALGIVGALVSRESLWALLLLPVPAFALWLALRQNVETRHRIEASLATAQRVARIGSLDWDLRHGDIRWSEILFRLLGYDRDRDRPSAEAYLERVLPEDRDSVQNAFTAAAEGRPSEIDHRIILPTGESRSFNLKFNGVPDRSGRIRRVVGTIHDVTERKLLEDRLNFQAYHDPLTTLPNRAFFMRKLESSFARYSRSGSIALLFLDLDRFKLINDTLGHEAGDQLLRVVARRIESCVRPNDVVARLGGDEFIVLLDAVDAEADILAVADRIVAAINQPLELLGNRAVSVSTSIGVVRPGPLHATAADLLRDADTALYRAKEEGRNRIAVFDAAMGAAATERLSLEADLHGAVSRGEMSLVYQPRVSLTSGRAQMVEALARWSHPTRGEISPSVFIPIAEETGMIDDIGRWIIGAAISEAKTWFSILNPAPKLSLNITRKQLLDEAFPRAIATLVRDAGLSAGQFRLEVPENALMADVETAIQAVARLRVAGFGVSVDDFGTGHSSLGSLRKFPIDMLQLDHQFVIEMGTSREATTVTQAVIGLAHGLELTVLAEGIERQDQVDPLIALGCELGQGTYFCPPLPAAEVLAFLLRNQQAASRSAPIEEPANLRRLHG